MELLNSLMNPRNIKTLFTLKRSKLSNYAFFSLYLYAYFIGIRPLWWPAPMAHSYRLGLVTYQVRIPVGPDICHRGCAYTVLQTVQRPGAYSAAYGAVHYKEPLKSFEIRVGHNPGFGLPFVAILP